MLVSYNKFSCLNHQNKTRAQKKVVTSHSFYKKTSPVSTCKALPFDKEKLEKARRQVAENTRQIQAELAKKQYEGFDADETVRVVFNGNQVPVSVEITEEAYQKGPEELSKRITEALKSSHHESVQGLKVAMTELAKKLGIQGLAGL